MKAQIKLSAFVIPYSYEREDGETREFCAYVRMPGEAEMVAMAKSLGYIFSKFKSSVAEGFDFLVLVKDWRIYLTEFLGGENSPNYLKQMKILDAFFERRLTYADIFDVESGEIIDKDDLDATDYDALKGSLLFFLSIFRYARETFKLDEMQKCITSLSFTEYKTYSRKLLQERKADDNVALPQTQSTGGKDTQTLWLTAFWVKILSGLIAQC